MGDSAELCLAKVTELSEKEEMKMKHHFFLEATI